MEGRGGCCMSRYAGGSYVYDASTVDRIMLRFRPIAPKPTVGGSLSPPANGANNPFYKGNKRRYNKRKRAATSDQEKRSSDGSCSGETEAVRRRVESWVTVEGVTSSEGWWVQEGRVGLEEDTCPGFVSDGEGRVRWTNKAYRKMVGQREGERDEEVNMIVWVVMKKGITHSPAAFTCRVRMKYTWRDQMRSMTVPCDVWRMDDGRGFAWRLDVHAALTLSLVPCT